MSLPTWCIMNEYVQAIVTDHVVLRGHYQTLPIALYGWAHTLEESHQVLAHIFASRTKSASLVHALESSLLRRSQLIRLLEQQTSMLLTDCQASWVVLHYTASHRPPGDAAVAPPAPARALCPGLQGSGCCAALLCPSEETSPLLY